MRIGRQLIESGTGSSNQNVVCLGAAYLVEEEVGQIWKLLDNSDFRRTMYPYRGLLV